MRLVIADAADLIRVGMGSGVAAVTFPAARTSRRWDPTATQRSQWLSS
jgi:hypothetical protein